MLPAVLLAAVRVGKRPWGIAVSNDISVIDVVARRVIATIRAGDGPWGVAVVSPRPY